MAAIKRATVQITVDTLADLVNIKDPFDGLRVLINDLKQFYYWDKSDETFILETPTVDVQNTDFGAATATTNPGTPTINGYYRAATAGTYTNFKDSNNNPLVLATNEFALLNYDVTTNSWSKQIIPINAPLSSYINKSTDVSYTPGKNLFNYQDLTTGFFIAYATGTLQANANSAISNYIPVTPSTSYYISGRVSTSGTRGVAYYDANKTLINTPTGVTTWGDGPLNGVYTTTSNTYFVRFTVKFLGSEVITPIQFEQGTVATTFEAYTPPKVNAIDGGTIIATQIVTNTGIKTLDTYLTERNFALVSINKIITSKNIFNPATINNGFILNYTNGAAVANTNGALSDYIKVNPSTSYFISGRISSSGTRGVAYYDINKTLINTPTGSTTWGDGQLNGVYTTTSDTQYMRITVKYSNVGDPSTVQVEQGINGTTFTPYSESNVINTVNSIAVDSKDTGLITDINVRTKSQWYGKKICWMGTSIPAGYPDTTNLKSYPNLACGKIGATIINVAQPTSLVRIANSDGSPLLSGFGQVCFGMTGAELTTAGYSPTMSYETKMLGNIDADLFVFDFGYNDYSADSTNFGTLPTNNINRNTFIGSMNYVIYRLLEQKPKARFAFFGHYENQERPLIATAQQVIASYWGTYLFDTWNRSGFSSKLVPPANTTTVKRTWFSDGIHPNIDTTGESTAVLTNLAISFLNSI